MFFGLTFIIPKHADSNRYKTILINAFESAPEDVLVYIETLFESSYEFFVPLLTYLVSRLSSFEGILFMAFAFFFGYFSLKTQSKVFKVYQQNKNKNALVFFVILVLANTITNINGVRMWTAAWVYVFFAYQYLVTNQKKYVLLAALAVTIHFSYIPLVILLVIYHIIGNRTLVYAVIAVLTLFISEINLEAVRNYATLFGDLAEKKASAYADEDYAEERAESAQQASWFIVVMSKGLKYLLIFTLGKIYDNFRKQKIDRITLNLLSFTLIILSFANIASLVPSGGRFNTIFYMFAAITCVHFFSKSINYKLDKVNLIGSVPVLLLGLVAFRVGAEYMSLALFVPTPLIYLATTIEESLGILIF